MWGPVEETLCATLDHTKPPFSHEELLSAGVLKSPTYSSSHLCSASSLGDAIYPQCICHQPSPHLFGDLILHICIHVARWHSPLAVNFWASDSACTQETYLSLLGFPFQFMASTCSELTESTPKIQSAFASFPFPTSSQPPSPATGAFFWVQHWSFEVKWIWVQIPTLSLLAVRPWPRHNLTEPHFHHV